MNDVEKPTKLGRLFCKLRGQDPDFPTYDQWTVWDRICQMRWSIWQDIRSWWYGHTPLSQLPWYFWQRVKGAFQND